MRQDSFCQKNPKNLSVLTSFPEEPLKERNSFSKNTQSGLDASVEFPLTLYKNQVILCPISVLSLSANGNSNPYLTGVL